MDRPQTPQNESRHDPFGTENTYFCDPYHTRLEQYGLEYIDRNTGGDDDIERVVILGYN